MNRTRPSLLRMIQNDYWAFLLTVMMVGFLVFHLYDLLMAGNRSQNPALTLLVLAVLAFLGCLWRLSWIANLISFGLEARGAVHGVGFFRGRGRIEIMYTFQGQRYLGAVAVLKNKQTGSYRAGDEVTVLVDPENPRRILLADIFK